MWPWAWGWRRRCASLPESERPTSGGCSDPGGAQFRRLLLQLVQHPFHRARQRRLGATSRYDGTALIAAAHLGHAEVVRELIRAGAPLNRVNNLGWTAVIEAIVLGDGGADHQATLKHLIDAKADLNLADRNGTRPLGLARGRGYAPMVKMLEAAGAH